jgi:hypothetical protein
MKKEVILLSLAMLCWPVQAFAGDANSSPVPQPPKTTVILVGTIHKGHYTNPDYSPEVLKEIILSLKPDAILNELPLSQVDPNGRPIYRDRDKHPEGWAADTVATQLGIRQIPFDRPDREKNFQKTSYFQRQTQSGEMIRKWMDDIKSKDPNSFDLKILELGVWASQAQSRLAKPEVINSDAFDSVIRIKKAVEYEITPQILAKYKGYETAASDCAFLGEQWRERNRIMADNIIKAAKKNPGKRLVAITGSEHRYILRDLLAKEESIELKEYWELNLRR